MQSSNLLKKPCFADRLKKVKWPLLLMLLPGIILTIVFCYIPMYGIQVAFKEISYDTTIWNAPWVGFKNFEFLFSTSDAWVITRNTVGYNLIFIVVGMVLNISCAVLLSELMHKKLSKIYQNVIFLPHLFSMVIVAYLVYALLSADFGWINTHILAKLGMEKVNWYVDKGKWPVILCLVHFWKSVGYGSILYIASMAGIDTSLYEAAEIDGASRWQRVIHVTIPCLSPIIVISIIKGIGAMFRSDFGLFYNVTMDNAALYSVTSTLDTFAYRALLVSGDTGMSAAVTFYQSFVGLILILSANTIIKKIDPDKAFF